MEKTMPDGRRPSASIRPARARRKVDVLPMKGFYPLPYEPRELAGRGRICWSAATCIGRAGAGRRLAGGIRPDAGGQVAQTPRLALADWLTEPAQPADGAASTSIACGSIISAAAWCATPSDFGVQGRAADAPGTARLAGQRSSCAAAGSTKHIHRLIVDIEHLPPEFAAARRQRDDRPGQHAVVALVAAPAGGRGDPRRHAGRQRRAGSRRRRSWLSEQDDEAARAAACTCLQQPRQSARVPVAVRWAERGAGELCAATRLDGAAASSLFAEQRVRSEPGQGVCRRVAEKAGVDRDRQIETAFLLSLGRLPDERRPCRRAAVLRGPAASDDAWCISASAAPERQRVCLSRIAKCTGEPSRVSGRVNVRCARALTRLLTELGSPDRVILCPFPPSIDRAFLIKPLGEREHDLDLSDRAAGRAAAGIHASGPAGARTEIDSSAGRGPRSHTPHGRQEVARGMAQDLIDMMERGLIDHIAMNGAGPIHDWEFALIGAATESVARYIQTGEFGLWRETEPR